MNNLAYRRDIDGLRGVAILIVVLYHAHLTYFSGGYVGVDIFFVISGFLITSIVQNDLEKKKFAFAQFYASRARRLMPALIALLIIVAALSLLVLLPDESMDFAINLIAVQFFILNFFLWHETGYFDFHATQRPLLHLWSLSVEEQFYLIWPLFLWSLHKLRKVKYTRVVTATAGVISFLISQWAAIHYPVAAFYLTPSRAWELMFGALLAGDTGDSGPSRTTRELAAVTGFTLIFISNIAYNHSTSYPGLHAILPCAGAALIIWIGKFGDNCISRLLSLSPLVGLGLISYSLYLWHWPLLSLASLILNRPLLIEENLAIVVASVGIAGLSWRYIEVPFRQRILFARIPKHALAAASVAAVLTTSIGMIIFGNHGAPWRFSTLAMRSFTQSQRHTSFTARCHTDQDSSFPPTHGCIFGKDLSADHYDAILWGDSHADALQPAVEYFARRYHLAVRQITKSGCPPLMGVEPGIEKTRKLLYNCIHFNATVLRLLAKSKALKLVILAADWQRYALAPLEGRPRGGDLFTKAITSTVDRIHRLGIPILIVGQVPVLPVDMSRCFLRESLLNAQYAWCKQVDSALVTHQSREIDRAILKVGTNLSATYTFLPRKILCDVRTCLGRMGGELLYRDTNHLSIAGARFLTAGMISAIPPSLWGAAAVGARRRDLDQRDR